MPASMSKAGSSNPSTTKGETYSSICPTLPQKPLDYCVNRMLGKVYNDLDELVADVKVWIAFKDRHFFALRIDRLSQMGSSN
uniref:Uncharacterized protein n=1 Tax=Acrobeloides nanus TaxID=290746 RepID=A0A914EN86_9BILA